MEQENLGMNLEQPLMPEIQALTWEQVEELRRRQLAGEPISQDEYRAAIAYFRQGRVSAQAAAPKGKRSALTSEDAKAAFEAALKEIG